MDTKDITKIGEFIKEERKKKKLSQENLAQLLHVTAGAVCKWEKGKNLPDQIKISEIANIFDCTVEEILNGKRNAQEKENSPLLLSEPAPESPMPSVQESDYLEPPVPEWTAPPDKEPEPDAPPPISVSFIPPEPSFAINVSGVGHYKKLHVKAAVVVSAFVLLAISISVITVMRTPNFHTVESFCGNAADGRWEDNCYYIIVEFRGDPQDNDFSEYSHLLQVEYQACFTEDIEKMVILYYRHYDSKNDSDRTMEYRFVFINKEYLDRKQP